VLFVSGDEKPDWWHQSERQALYPRYELLDEFHRTSKRWFHIARFSTFLEAFGASDKAVAEVRQEERQATSPEGPTRLYGPSLRGVTKWLMTQWPNSIVERSGLSSDLVVIEPSGREIGVEICVAHSSRNAVRRLQFDCQQAREWLSARPEGRYLIVVVAIDERIAIKIGEHVASEHIIDSKIGVAVGVVVNDTFTPYVWRRAER
jgi:hypothetical protein